MLKIQIFFLMLMFLFLSGCGTLSAIGHVGYEKIYVSTDHDNSTIKLNGKIITQTDSGYILVDKKIDGSFITCSKQGYKDSNFYLQRRINAWVTILDTLLIIPLIIDAFTGELFYIEPDNIKLFLSKEER